LHTNSLDEAYALPGEQAVTIALRTQQVLAYESGVTRTPDPLGGSYFLEKLTLDTEAATNQYIRRIDEMGGMVPAIEAGFPQSEIATASYRYQCEVESGERTIVGVNRFQSVGQPIELLQIDETSARHQREKLAALRARRDNIQVRRTLDALQRAAEGAENTMPRLLDAVRAYATLGEICDSLRAVFGTYQETTHL
jgi:methylmalonyl-CoA mutase N-terminal domain/subunit